MVKALKWLLALLVVVLLFQLFDRPESVHRGDDRELSGPITGTTLDEIDREIAGWAGGRNWSWILRRIDNETGLVMEVEIDASANEVAQEGYCQVLWSIGESRLELGHHLHVHLYVDGQLARDCR